MFRRVVLLTGGHLIPKYTGLAQRRMAAGEGVMIRFLPG